MLKALLFEPYPIYWPQLAVLAVGSFIGFTVLIWSTRSARSAEKTKEAKSTTSRLGIMIQGLGIFVAWFGPMQLREEPVTLGAILAALVVAALLLSSTSIFRASVTEMGKNWSFVARTREDHQLVQSGPFAYVRHPIYSCLFLWMIAAALGMGHLAGLLVAVPLFIVGTMIRVLEEEKLLRNAFGTAYDDYAARVKRFIPSVW
jgi:protein-S-isoprenylcysteine O-methyltransferase Ste14